VTVPAADFVTLLQEHLGLSRAPGLDDDLTTDLALDSLARLELWVAFEHLAGGIVDPGAMEGCHTVRDLHNLANQLLSRRAG
jgi:acyl carrier protein